MEKNQIKICSDPYHKHIDYFWYEENGKWTDMSRMDNASLNTDRFITSSISHIAYDIFSVITGELYNSTVGMKIIFEGTEDDFEDLSTVRRLYFSNYDIVLEKGSRKMKRAKEAMPDVEQSFDRLKDFFGQYPDKETEKVIAKYTDAVKSEIALCVMGLYSSGKSAFINSLIGQEVLPSASDPATAKIYKIWENNTCMILFKFRGQNYKMEFTDSDWRVNQNPNSEIMQQIKKIIKDKNPVTAEQHMYWTLFALNEYAKTEGKENHVKLAECADKLLSSAEKKDANTEEKKIEKLLEKYRIKDLISRKMLPPNKLGDMIEVHVKFKHSYLPLDKFKFVIYDTPGSNSVMFREHADILKDSLEQQTNGLPVFVTEPDSMDGKDNNEIMTMIDKLGGSLDVSNLMLVVNKSDAKSKETIEEKAQNKDNLVLTRWKASKVYFVSSIMGLGGKKDNPDDKNEWIHSDYRKIYKDNKTTFGDSSNDDYIRLFDYNILSRDESERIARRTEHLDASELLVWNSGIPCVEEEIGIFAQKYALYNKCSQAVQYLKEAADLVKEDIEEARKKSDGLREDIEKRLDEKKKKLVEELKAECDRLKREFARDYADVVTKRIVKKYQDSDRIKGVVDSTYISCRGKRDIDKLKEFNSKIEIKLQNDIDAYSLEASGKTEAYWRECAEKLRYALMAIVVENPDLTQDQKEILKKVVLRVAMVLSTHETLNIINSSAIKKKGKKFLWIDLTRIDRVESKKLYYKALNDDIFKSNGEVASKNEKNLNIWIDCLLEELEVVVSSFNPVLTSLTKELKAQKNIIASKQKQEAKIKQEIHNIKSLLEFEEV